MLANSKISDFRELVKNSEKFFYRIPTTANRIESIAANDVEKQNEIVRQANGTRIIVRQKVLSLIDEFLALKRANGSSLEQRFYQTMTSNDFIKRLISKRPLSYIGPAERTLLRNGTVIANASKQWAKVGSDEEEVIQLNDYLSLDEMQISSLIGVSTPTFFINDGNRQNQAKKGERNSYEESGIFVGLVGACFSKTDKMEYKHIIVTEKFSTNENGYGKCLSDESSSKKRKPSNESEQKRKRVHDVKLLQIWAKFYEIGNGDHHYFPSYKEVLLREKTEGDRFVKITDAKRKTAIGSFFNVEVYKKRISITAETLLLEANKRGEETSKNVFLHVVGFGLGVWQLIPKQANWLVQCFADAIESLLLPHISTINFSWFPSDIQICGKTKNGEIFRAQNGNKIRIEFSKRSTAAKVSDDQLLVTTYAWDSNSFPGNEFWMGSLKSTSDSAAASCSTISQLQNPYINPFCDNIQVL